MLLERRWAMRLLIQRRYRTVDRKLEVGMPRHMASRHLQCLHNRRCDASLFSTHLLPLATSRVTRPAAIVFGSLLYTRAGCEDPRLLKPMPSATALSKGLVTQFKSF